MARVLWLGCCLGWIALLWAALLLRCRTALSLIPAPPLCPPPAHASREVIAALEAAQQEPKPPISAMFEDVYDTMPWHLRQQLEEVGRVGACGSKG